MRMKRRFAKIWHLTAAACLLVLVPLHMARAEPWRLDKALGTPDWLSVTGSYRVRYEGVDDGFRPVQAAGDRILAERFLLHARADFGGVYFGAEFEDSRNQLDDASTPLGTDDVNTMELLQAYAGFRSEGVFADGDKLDVQAGRVTIDVGSRRLVARNAFRNTINAFTGFSGLWSSQSGWRAQSFVVLPVDRRPQAFDRLRDNAIDFDYESFKTVFWGAHLSKDKLIWGATAEFYVFGLHERDSAGLSTANRQLVTPGLRLNIKPARGAFDAELETAVQFGTSRSSTAAANTTELDHAAGFVHVHVGRMLDAPWSPRFVLQYDFASGDDDPTDGKNNRFDTLFGARRFEFGPTGIWGALARSNISSPGVRAEVKPSAKLGAFVGYRAVWLASGRDTLTTAGLRDTTGNSGRFVGNQVETQITYNVLPGNLSFEVGGAWLSDGKFLRDAPSAPANGDALYGYMQIGVSF